MEHEEGYHKNVICDREEKKILCIFPMWPNRPEQKDFNPCQRDHEFHNLGRQLPS